MQPGVSAAASATVASLLDEAGSSFRLAGFDQPRAEARWLLARILGLAESHLLAHPDAAVDAAGVTRYRDAVRRRAAHEPFAYVVGERDFYGRAFLVDRRVLVPRPETELLIEAALAVLRTPWERGLPARPGFVTPGGQDGRAPRSLVVDVGTGSGAIACTLALETSDTTVVACDVSLDALAVAAANRDRLGVRDRLHLVRGSLLDWLGRPADLVLANLPYIPSARVASLMPEVANWEPKLALDGGADGLDLVRALLADAYRTVMPGGTVLLELDPEQMTPARKLLPGASSTIIRDLAGSDRVLRLDVP